MKLVVCFALTTAFFLASSISSASIKIEFRVNKIQGFYNFVETVTGNQHRSAVIRELFEKSSFNNDKYKALIQKFRMVSADLDQGFNYKGYLTEH